MSYQKDSPESRAVTHRMTIAITEIMAIHPKVKTKQAFAEAIGVLPQGVSRWFSKTARCTLVDVVATCQKFKVSPDFLIMGRGSIFTDKEPSRPDVRITGLEVQLSEMQGQLQTFMESAGRH